MSKHRQTKAFKLLAFPPYYMLSFFVALALSPLGDFFSNVKANSIIM